MTQSARPRRTDLVYHRDGDATKYQVRVTAVFRLSDLSDEDQALFKATDTSASVHAIVTDATIFHAQGGGQPSDTGYMSSEGVKFSVSAARMGASPDTDGLVLHLGTYEDAASEFSVGGAVEQCIDVEQRIFLSRYHTAGHVLGAAVRSLLGKSIPGFDELKASHFPDSAACEFQGLIEGKHKDSIQKKVDELVVADLPVEIDWWDEEDFRRAGLDRLIPAQKIEGEKWRVVKIVGAEVYPCGGTHVKTTQACGKTTVKKIGRSKGNSRVSYSVA